MKKVLKMIGILVGGVIALIILIVILFLNLSPQFGGKISEKQKEIYENSENYANGKFINRDSVDVDMSFNNILKMLKQYVKPQPNSTPKNNIDVAKIDSIDIAKYQGETRMFWFGHSTFLLEIAGKNILIDPMFGDFPAPHPVLGSKRFSKELPIKIEKLPFIDVVILSHDHYDHLDYGSIMKLKDKVGVYYTPLGVGQHLKEWGVSSEDIVELDWWQEANYDSLVFKCAPAQHFSGRGIGDRANTLWSSWVIQSSEDNIFVSGDSG